MLTVEKIDNLIILGVFKDGNTWVRESFANDDDVLIWLHRNKIPLELYSE